MRQLAGFVVAALVAAALIGATVLLQRGSDEAPADDAATSAAAAVATAAAPTPDISRPSPAPVLILIRPDQSATLPSYYPHIPPELLHFATARTTEADVDAEILLRAARLFAGDGTRLQIVDLRDRY